MILRSCLVFLPIFAMAQEPAPQGVEQELRARVSAFYQNFVDGTPRKAETFVAEDTKDYYYNAGKLKYESFTIGKITFGDTFKTAIVTVVGKTERLIAGQAVLMDVPADTHWKIENGKWCWTYHETDYAVTPMGALGGTNPPPPTDEEAKRAVKPKNTSPAEIRAAGMALLQQQTMGLDRSTVTMSADKASSTEVTFTNGADGEIQIALDAPVVRGLTAKLDKMTVPAHGKAVLSLSFDPTDKSGPKDVWEPRGSIPFRIIAAPFDRVFPVYVMFAAAK